MNPFCPVGNFPPAAPAASPRCDGLGGQIRWHLVMMARSWGFVPLENDPILGETWIFPVASWFLIIQKWKMIFEIVF